MRQQKVPEETEVRLRGHWVGLGVGAAQILGPQHPCLSLILLFTWLVITPDPAATWVPAGPPLQTQGGRG